MGQHWYELLRPVCEEACDRAGTRYGADVVLFYTARWCQKESRAAEPDLAAFDPGELRTTAAKIAAHLEADGPLVERLVDSAGDSAAWTTLRGELRASVRRYAPDQAHELADEALQKVAEVLLSGTPPSLAAERLADGPEGPANEFVFRATFVPWARRIAINHAIDELRRAGREPPLPPSETGPAPRVDRAVLEQARAALPALLDAVRQLPGKQREVMVASLSRSGLDPIAREHLCTLAPDLFRSTATDPGGSDAEIAAALGTTRRLVAANRSVARRKLARANPLWAVLLDALLPHRSTRPVAAATGNPGPEA
jgi:hypothetical protein